MDEDIERTHVLFYFGAAFACWLFDLFPFHKLFFFSFLTLLLSHGALHLRRNPFYAPPFAPHGLLFLFGVCAIMGILAMWNSLSSLSLSSVGGSAPVLYACLVYYYFSLYRSARSLKTYFFGPPHRDGTPSTLRAIVPTPSYDDSFSSPLPSPQPPKPVFSWDGPRRRPLPPSLSPMTHEGLPTTLTTSVSSSLSLYASHVHPNMYSPREAHRISELAQRDAESLRAYYEELVRKKGPLVALEYFKQDAFDVANGVADPRFPPSNARGNHLTYVTYQDRNYSLSAASPVLTIGRFSRCDLVSQEAHVSRIHSIVILRGPHVIIIDNGSQNGIVLLNEDGNIVDISKENQRKHIVFPHTSPAFLQLTSFSSNKKDWITFCPLECLVCARAPRCCRVRPCLHLVCCKECLPTLRFCPLCSLPT